jgi:taurine dioxygenase
MMALDAQTASCRAREQWQFLLQEGAASLYSTISIEKVDFPVVRTHPETGRKSLFVNRGFTSHITQLAAESDALLQFLYAHATQPQFTVRYHSHAGDLGFWDNRVS